MPLRWAFCLLASPETNPGPLSGLLTVVALLWDVTFYASFYALSLLKVCRYVERNPLTAGLVERAEDWRWSSLWVREHGTDEQKALLHDWPTPRPGDWLARVNAVTTKREQSRWDLSLWT